MLSWLTVSTMFLLSEWTIRLVMLPVVTQRRRPNSATAWLLVIFFLPWFGWLLYFLIGENRLPRRRTEKHRELLRQLRRIGQRFDNHPAVEQPDLGREAMSAVKLAQKLGDMPILGGNHCELMTQTATVIDHLIADIEAAQDHVHLAFYIYADDSTGQRVANALAAAAARGVHCRVLVDAVGSRPMFRRLAGWMRERGIELHAMLPVNLFRRQVSRMDLRNHRKVVVVDGRIAYTGSQNIVDPDYGTRHLAWHDMMVRITGPVVLELQAVFVGDWFFETDTLPDGELIFPSPTITGDMPVQVLPSGPSYATENYQRVVVAAIYAAQRRVVITTPYLVPDEALLQAIQVAILRGVQVDVIVPQKCDQIIVGLAAKAYYKDLLEIGVNLYLYQPGLLHSKSIAVDDRLSLIGSSNFDIRSFALNFEISLLCYGPSVTARLLAVHSDYIAQSNPFTMADWKKSSKARRLFENIARLMSPLL